MRNIVLQLCDPSKTFMDRMLNFEFWHAFACQYTSPVGFYVVGLLVYSSISLPIYIRTGSIRIPAVLMILIGPFAVSQVAGVSQGIVLAVVVGSIVAAPFLLYYSFSR